VSFSMRGILSETRPTIKKIDPSEGAFLARA